MTFKRIEAGDPAYQRLSDIYEAEFSPLTGARPNADGSYPISTSLDEGHMGYFVCEAGEPIGFIVICIEDQPYDVCEMFVLPDYRDRHFASELFCHILRLYPGRWQIKQLVTAKRSRAFWLKFLQERYPYTEERYEDAKWGPVYRQLFET